MLTHGSSLIKITLSPSPLIGKFFQEHYIQKPREGPRAKGLSFHQAHPGGMEKHHTPAFIAQNPGLQTPPARWKSNYNQQYILQTGHTSKDTATPSEVQMLQLASSKLVCLMEHPSPTHSHPPLIFIPLCLLQSPRQQMLKPPKCKTSTLSHQPAVQLASSSSIKAQN